MIAEDPRQHTASGAIHRVYRELEIRLRNCLEVSESADSFYVCSLQVNFCNRCFLAVGHRDDMQLVFDPLHDRRSTRAAKVGLELHSIPVPGVMTRGDDDAARGVELLYGKRN